MKTIHKPWLRSMALLLAASLLVPASVGFAQRAESSAVGPQVKLESGPISGQSAKEGKLHTYKGIPYAAPPVGDLRWKAPQAVKPWTDVREAKAFGPRAMQGGGGGGGGGRRGAAPATGQAAAPQRAAQPAVSTMSEDCLYLNVVTPAKTTGDKLPVLVNIHGGNFTGGSGQMDMSRLAESENIVCVGLNYRLGALGFMAHPLLSAESPEKVSGNYGLLDQIAALKWVQRNIAAFGGDINNVTITGCSAGGESVLYMMASPMAKGLFHRAIPCAGPYGGRTPTLANAERTGAGLITRLGVEGGPDALKKMRELTAQQITGSTPGGLGAQGAMYPTVDKWVLSDTSLNVFRAGKQNNVPMMIGSGAADIAGPANQSGDRGFAAAMSTVSSKAYIYVFTHGAASHCLDQGYILGTAADRAGATSADKATSRNMMQLWGQFIRTGDPNVKGLVEWPAYVEKEDKYLDIGEQLQVKTGVLAASRGGRGGRGGAARGTSDQPFDEDESMCAEELECEEDFELISAVDE